MPEPKLDLNALDAMIKKVASYRPKKGRDKPPPSQSETGLHRLDAGAAKRLGSIVVVAIVWALVILACASAQAVEGPQGPPGAPGSIMSGDI